MTATPPAEKPASAIVRAAPARLSCAGVGKIVVSGRGRRRVLAGHPWVYAGDVSSGDAAPGELVPVLDPHQNPLGWGLFSTSSKIAVRLVSRGAERPERGLWLERVRRAVELRRELGLLAPRGACRLLSGDAEGVPGMIVDRYADVLVLSSGCPGADLLRELVVELLDECLPFVPRAVLDRSDSTVRRLEALEPRVEWLRGAATEPLEVEEQEAPGAPCLSYEVSVTEGHKTGHYLDQAENRRKAGRLAGGRDVLDVFCYDGLFGVRAALAGARSVLCLDQSAEAGERCLRNAERNGVQDRLRFERVIAMKDLKGRAGGVEAGRFGLVVVDPPAFARNRREVEGAARGYRELNRRALSLVGRGGWLVSASCSYHVRRGDFLDHLAQAALLAGRDALLVECAGASPDHPVSPLLPESEYLKCAFLHVE